MSYNTELQSNNAELQEILDAVNDLPNAGGGSEDLSEELDGQHSTISDLDASISDLTGNSTTIDSFPNHSGMSNKEIIQKHTNYLQELQSFLSDYIDNGNGSGESASVYFECQNYTSDMDNIVIMGANAGEPVFGIFPTFMDATVAVFDAYSIVVISNIDYTNRLETSGFNLSEMVPDLLPTTAIIFMEAGEQYIRLV